MRSPCTKNDDLAAIYKSEDQVSVAKANVIKIHDFPLSAFPLSFEVNKFSNMSID